MELQESELRSVRRLALANGMENITHIKKLYESSFSFDYSGKRFNADTYQWGISEVPEIKATHIKGEGTSWI